MNRDDLIRTLEQHLITEEGEAQTFHRRISQTTNAISRALYGRLYSDCLNHQAILQAILEVLKSQGKPVSGMIDGDRDELIRITGQEELAGRFFNLASQEAENPVVAALLHFLSHDEQLHYAILHLILANLPPKRQTPAVV